MVVGAVAEFCTWYCIGGANVGSHGDVQATWGEQHVGFVWHRLAFAAFCLPPAVSSNCHCAAWSRLVAGGFPSGFLLVHVWGGVVIRPQRGWLSRVGLSFSCFSGGGFS